MTVIIVIIFLGQDKEMHRRKTHRAKTAIYRPGRVASQESNPANACVSDLQPPELWENKFVI